MDQHVKELQAEIEKVKLSYDELRNCWLNLVDSLPAFCDKAAALFAANNWTYSEPEGMVVPDTKRLEGIAYNLAWAAYQNAPDGVSSGRLKVCFRQDKKGAWTGTVEVVPASVQVNGQRP